MSARHGVLVLGMHRSGTSMVSGLLVRAGLQAPRTALPPTEWNVEGYGESAILHTFHERLLQQAGTQWDAHTRIDATWLAAEASAALGAECRDLLSREFDLARPFVLKDPRVCRLMPFWRSVLEAERIEPAAVLVLRHPAAVAASLAARDGLPYDLSLLAWLRHVLEAEYHSRNMARAIVRYDQALTNWRPTIEHAAEALGCRDWAGWTPPHTADVDRFVRQDLRHHTAEALPRSAPAIVDWIERAWAALLSFGRDRSREVDAMAALDAVRLEFDDLAAAFGLEVERRQALALARVRALEEEGRLLGSRLAQVTGEADALRGRVDVASVELAAAQSRMAALDAECAALRSSMRWRMTAPLRAFYGFLLNIRKP